MKQYRELASRLARPFPLALATFATAGFLAGSSKVSINSKQLPNQPKIVATSATSESDRAAMRASGFGQLPLTFEPNVGQSDKSVKFLSRGPGYTMYLTAQEAVMVLRSRPNTRKHEKPGTVVETPAVIRMKIVGASDAAAVRGTNKLSGYSNYLVGNDPKNWHTRVPNYAGVEYAKVYPGVDLVYYGNQRQLEYDFVVEPGADASRIQLAFDGADQLRLDQKGDLILSVNGREIRQQKPVVYQVVAGNRVPVTAGYELLADRRQVKFTLAKYDRSRPLVIDPVIGYATYIGSAGTDFAYGVTADTANPGIAFVTGETNSTTFPTSLSKTPLGTSGGFDAYVTKLDTTKTNANSYLFTTYFGGSDDDVSNGVRVSSTGIYLVGSTRSTNFPTVNPAQASNGGSWDAFLCKLNTTGTAFIYSTYFGGVNDEYDFSLAVDASGALHAVGQSSSPSLTITPSPLFLPNGGLNHGTDDAFVTRIQPNGSLGYATFYGGAGTDHGYGIAIDSGNNVYVGGDTTSANFPTTSGAYSVANAGGASDGFVLKFLQSLNGSGVPTGLTVVYSTYIGGAGADSVYDIATDSSGNAYLTGLTDSTNFPTTVGTFQNVNAGGQDAFVTKLNSSGSALVYSTYMGGLGNDYGMSIAVDGSGNAYVSGTTGSSNLPTARALSSGPQTTFGGGVTDAFALKLDSTGANAAYLTYYGGGGDESGNSISISSTGAYMAGSTTSGYNASTLLPGVSNGFQTTYQGDQYGDGYFVSLVEPVSCTIAVSPTTFNLPNNNSNNNTYTVTTGAGCPVTSTVNPNSPDPTFVTIQSGGTLSGGGSVVFRVTSNSNNTPRTNTITVTGQVNSVTVTVVQARGGASPVVSALSPASTVSTTQTYTVQFNDPDGYQDIDVTNILVNKALDARSACYLAYSRPTNVLYIVADSGDPTQLTGHLMNGTGTIGNSQCTVNLANSSVAGSGTTLTMALNITYSSAFEASGNKVIYVAARDTLNNNSGWQTMGSVGAVGQPIVFPKVLGVSPNSGTGNFGVFTFSFQDQTAATNLQTAWVIINSAIDSRASCTFAYYRPGNQIYLYPDNGDGASSKIMTLAGTVSVSNSQCTIAAAGASVSTNGDTLTLTLPIAFNSPAFSGNRVFFEAVQTLSGATATWQPFGAWRVP